jgi:hypothetical protein
MFLGTCRPWFLLSCTCLLLATLCSCATIGPVGPQDPLVGTWVMNPARSKFNPGPAPKSLTVTYETAAQGLHVTTVTVAADGSSAKTEYTAAYDGKDYPITGAPPVEAVSLRQIDALTSERIDKVGGKPVTSYTRQVYADGRTLVVTQKGNDASGSPVDNEIIFEKQKQT